jgi:DNA-binding LacI/PurR family transcriptional regulator
MLGQTMVEMLIRQINGEDLWVPGIELNAQLIVRNTTGPVQK